MFVAALVTAVALHAMPPPAAQLSAAERAASFHVLALPASMQLLGAEASHDGARVRLEYSIEGALITIEERVVAPAVDATAAPLDQNAERFDLDGYPATYRELTGYRELSALTWYRPDVTVEVASRDRVNAPLLVDVALSLR